MARFSLKKNVSRNCSPFFFFNPSMPSSTLSLFSDRLWPPHPTSILRIILLNQLLWLQACSTLIKMKWITRHCKELGVRQYSIYGLVEVKELLSKKYGGTTARRNECKSNKNNRCRGTIFSGCHASLVCVWACPQACQKFNLLLFFCLYYS